MPTPRPPMARSPMVRSPAPAPSSRHATDDGGVNTMTVAGALLCLAGALALLGGLKAGLAGAHDAGAIGVAFLVLVFGAALLQGSGAVRTFLLWTCGICALLLSTVVFATPDRRLQALWGGSVLSCLGYVTLLWKPRASVARAALGVMLVLAGAGAIVGMEARIAGRTEPANGRDGAASPEHRPELVASGLSTQAPPASAPVDTALSDAAVRVTQACPFLTPEAVRMIGARIPPTSPPETYFRTAWVWAVRGQQGLDPATARELGELINALLAGMPAAERARFTGFTERVRSGGRTTQADDAAAMGILLRALAALPAESAGRLRTLMDQLIMLGGLT